MELRNSALYGTLACYKVSLTSVKAMGNGRARYAFQVYCRKKNRAYRSTHD